MLLKNVYLNGKQKDILIKDNTFLKIADKIEIEGEQIFNCRNKAIFPSFCNMHTHAAMTFLRGVGEDMPLFDWLEKEIWPREAKLTPEAVYHFSKFAILEMIKTGTTAFLDMYFHTDQTISAACEMGIRAGITYVGMDLFDPKETAKRIECAKDFLSTKTTCNRIIKGLSAHSVYTASEELIRTFKDISRTDQNLFHIHVSETQKEVEDCLQKYQKRPLLLLNDWGVLDQNTIMAHCVHFNDDEIKMTSETKAVVVHNPVSNLKLNSGQLRFQKYLDKGIRLTLGTDGASSNNSLSMIDEMKAAALMAKTTASSTLAGRVDDVFKTATLNGFEALNIKAGKIEEGYLADFILVDLNHFSMLPNINILSNLIYSADSSCITDVFCDGKVVMKDRYVQDEEKIIENFKNAMKILK